MLTLNTFTDKIKLLYLSDYQDGNILILDQSYGIDKLPFEKFHSIFCKNILGVIKKPATLVALVN